MRVRRKRLTLAKEGEDSAAKTMLRRLNSKLFLFALSLKCHPI